MGLKIVVVAGEGQLADQVQKALESGAAENGGTYSALQVVRLAGISGAMPRADLVLVLQDQDDSSMLREAERQLWTGEAPWLCAYISSREGIAGPLVRPGQAGCSHCAETRLTIASRNRRELDDLFIRLANPDYVPPSPKELPSAGFRHMALIISAEAAKVLRGESTLTEGHVYILDFDHLSSSLHFFLPDGGCPVCGRLPEDSPGQAAIALKPRRKIAPDSYRSLAIGTMRQTLFRDYWDRRTGLFNNKHSDLVSAFANSAINLPLYMSDELTGGRSHSYATSELAGILEGLERYSGTTPRGKRPSVYDSYSRLKEQAVDPAQTGLHSRAQYEQPDFPFEPFDAEAPMSWVWGYSFLQERPILVPELLAYYSMGYAGGFVYETSNGCALGGSLEEAVLHGILEVVERDSFLITWYAQLPVPRLDPRSSGDAELTLMTDRLEAVTGYRISLYNTTMENGIPGIWAVARNGTGQSGANLVCAAAAHLHPVLAAKSALQELASNLSLVQECRSRRGEEAPAMYTDSSLVREMEDHSLLYSLPQAEERLHFLLEESRPLLTFDQSFPPAPAHGDLTEDLKGMLEQFRSLNMEVIAVNQSSPETLRNGLHAVKVLIPGMLPMTFGHQHRRLEGLRRVLEVPATLGYASRILRPEELQPYPHPFP
jgi:ribosomal protein S12 methylthiotransferase accessory factor